MPVTETIEAFPIFDPQTTVDAPGISAAVGTGVAAVGAPDALGGAGAIVIYTYSAERNGWGYVGLLSGSNVAGGEQVRGMGTSCVAFGDTLVVGAQGDAQTPGRVFVLSPAYGKWSYTAFPVIAELVRPSPTKGDMYGASVAHGSDGTDDYIAIGAPAAAPPVGKSGGGQVFVFKGLAPSNAPWSTVVNPNTAGTEGDKFGAGVAINASGDGTLTLAVGAPGASGGEGVVYAGRTAETGSSKFELGEPLAPRFAEAADDFHTAGYGSAVALTGGVTLAVGSPNDPNFVETIEGTGAVWTYHWADGAFALNGEGASLFGPAQDSKFGISLAFPETDPSEAGTSADQLVVGAPGVAGAYQYSTADGGTTFSEDAQLAKLSGKAGDQFGGAVAASKCVVGSWVFVGAPGNPKATVEGGGYLFATADPQPKWLDTPALISAPPVRWGGLTPDWWKKWTPEIPNTSPELPAAP